MSIGQSQTPSQWVVKSLAELGGRVTSGSRAWAANYSEFGSLFVRITNLTRESIRLDLDNNRYVRIDPNDVEARRTRLAIGDLLISITADIGIVGLVDERVPEPAYINQHVARVRLDPALADSRYVAYYLSSWEPQRRFVGATDQGAKAGMNLATVLSLTTLAPPLVEQSRIASILADVDDLIASLERLIAKKRAIKQGMMQELLTGRTRLPGFESDWATVRLLDMVTIRSGQADPRTPEYRNLPLIAPDHIESGTGRLVEVRTAAEQGAISGKYTVEPGDVIYSKIRPYLCKVHLAEFKALCSADMYALRPNPGADGHFLLNLLLSEQFTSFAASTSMRSGIPKLNRIELAEFEFQAPGLDEQRQIGSALSDSDALITALECRLEATRAIKTGMMQELLTGRTRLPVEDGAS